MPLLFGAAARAVLVVVTCPHCGEAQTRARGQQSYRCSRCKRAFVAKTSEHAGDKRRR